MESLPEQTQSISTTLFRTITFHLSQQTYALDILYIRDIVIGKQIYCIPNSDPILMGVTNIRGEILPVYSLKTMLGMEERIEKENKVLLELKDEEYLITISHEKHLFAIIVDYVDKNISITPENYNEGSYMSKWSQDIIFSGIIIDGTDNILLIDASALIKLLIKRAKYFQH